MTHLDFLLKDYQETKKTKKIFTNVLHNKQNCADDLILKTQFLPESASTHQRLYHLIYDVKEIPKCLYCDDKCRHLNIHSYLRTCNKKDCVKKLNTDATKDGVRKKYGVDNISQTQEWRDKIKVTSLEKYGVEHYLQSKEIQDKIEKTNLELYGHKRILSSVEHREKGKKTLLEKYGVDHIMKCKEGKQLAENGNMIKYGVKKASMHQSIKDKTKDFFIEKYGETTPLLNSEIKIKSKKTLLEKYGVSHNSQISDVHDSPTKYKRKPYILPSGKKILVQGHEDKALDMLLTIFDESDIVFSSKEMEKIFGRLMYFHNDIEHRYFPDFYIKSANRVIEVKSKWTMESNLEINLLKEKSCLDKGLNFKFMIID